MTTAWMIAVLLLAADQGAAQPLNLLPLQTDAIFWGEVLEARPSNWEAAEPGTETRTVEVDLHIKRVLKGQQAAPAAALTASCPQRRFTSGRVRGTEEYWSYTEFKRGDSYLVFSNGGVGDDLGALFAKPVSAWKVAANDLLIDDVTFILGIADLDVDTQASQLLVHLQQSSGKHSELLAQCLSALALVCGPPKQAALLARIGAIDGLPFGEKAKAELLRTLHIGLLMQEHPSSQAIQCLAAASLRTLCRTPRAKQGSLSRCAESVTGVYLPWLVTADWNAERNAAINSLSELERHQAAQTLKRLCKSGRLNKATTSCLLQVVRELGE